MSTKRKYAMSLVDSLQKNAKLQEYKGVTVLVKPIPEGGADGDMDPRIYKSMKMASTMMKLMPKGKKAETIQEKVLPLRKMFSSYKGAYICNEGIATEEFDVASSDGHRNSVRMYKRTNAGANLPMFIYYHGGGFFGGSQDIVEQMCKMLVQLYDCIAFNIDYRLCPESHYPLPHDDCFYSTKYIYEHAAKFGGDATRFIVAGDSAGGNLAATIALRDREEKTGMVKAQVLFYPAVNIANAHTEFYTGVHSEQYRRSAKHAKVLDATLALMTGALSGDADSVLLDDVYLQGHLDPKHIYASPILDDQHDVPPTLLIFGEHDFLTFENFAYAQTLTKAGIDLKTIIYRGMGHGFGDQIGVAPQAEDAMMEIAKWLKEKFG